MKKITFIILTAIILQGCSSGDETPVSMEPDNLMESKAPELDFYGVPNKSASNIQVNDFIKIILQITRLKGATFIIAKPIGKSATFHDILNTDYELYIESTTQAGGYLKVESLNLKEGKNIFFIKPLLPGTFQIKLEEDTKSFQFEEPIVFTAVKIETSTSSGQDGQCGLSKWRHRDYWFTINAGSQTFDNLLLDSNAIFSYSTVYDKINFSSDLAINTNQKIINTRNECGSFPSIPPVITSITIKKTINSETQIIAVYYDIPIQ